jgi:hypothetical protein
VVHSIVRDVTSFDNYTAREPSVSLTGIFSTDRNVPQLSQDRSEEFVNFDSPKEYLSVGEHY